jgi:hypothetical protein
MKRIVLTLTLLLATSSVASAQFAPSTENLRGLTGVRLIVMFHRADGLDEAQRPGLLKVLEAETVAKLQQAGIPMFHTADEVRNAGYPRLIVLITLDKLNGFVYPVVTEVKLMQRVQLARNPSIETDAMTWSLNGVGGPTLDIERIGRLVANEVDHFIKDYESVNPKRSARLGLTTSNSK